MFINLWVKNKSSGKVHQVGTDEYDALLIIFGKVEYQNLKSGKGTAYGGYKFCDAPSSVQNNPLELKLDKSKCDPSEEYKKCNFCSRATYTDYDFCKSCLPCYVHFKPDKAKVIQKAKETRFAITDVIALINL